MPTAPITGALPNGTAQLHQQLVDATNMDQKLRGEIYSRLLETQSGSHNAFEKFTSPVDARSDIAGGVRSIFARKTDLKAGGGQTVNFNVLGPPGGPGAKGAQSLVDRVSAVQLSTYSATVAFHRDAISFSKDLYEFLSAGKVLESTSLNLLAKKMGIEKQNHMAMRLIRSAKDSNTYRPRNRLNTGALKAGDSLVLSDALAARARLSTIGGRPLSQRIGATGYPIKNFLVFGTDMAFLPLRNDESFMSIAANGKANDAVTSGELFDWQGLSWYEMPSVDEKWDDYIGSPFLPKAKLGSGLDATNSTMIVNSANLKSQYFQFFPNAPYSFDGEAATQPDTNSANEYYAWICRPDGGRGFVAYVNTGFADGANRLAVTKILSNTYTGKQFVQVGNFNAGSGATVSNSVITPGTGANLPTGFTYYNSFPAGSIVIPANKNGVPIGYGFMFGAMSACFAHGRIERAMIEQEEDFGFIKKRGYEMIFGTCVTKDPFSDPSGYLLLEHQVEHEGYPVPMLAL